MHAPDHSFQPVWEEDPKASLLTWISQEKRTRFGCLLQATLVCYQANFTLCKSEEKIHFFAGDVLPESMKNYVTLDSILPEREEHPCLQVVGIKGCFFLTRLFSPSLQQPHPKGHEPCRIPHTFLRYTYDGAFGGCVSFRLKQSTISRRHNLMTENLLL